MSNSGLSRLELPAVPHLKFPGHESSPLSTAKHSRSERRTAGHRSRPSFSAHTPLHLPLPLKSMGASPARSNFSEEAEVGESPSPHHNLSFLCMQIALLHKALLFANGDFDNLLKVKYVCLGSLSISKTTCMSGSANLIETLMISMNWPWRQNLKP